MPDVGCRVSLIASDDIDSENLTEGGGIDADRDELEPSPARRPAPNGSAAEQPASLKIAARSQSASTSKGCVMKEDRLVLGASETAKGLESRGVRLIEAGHRLVHKDDLRIVDKCLSVPIR